MNPALSSTILHAAGQAAITIFYRQKPTLKNLYATFVMAKSHRNH
jgi:hypothetical protein